jgi:CheY-like chemotaxis protein
MLSRHAEAALPEAGKDEPEDGLNEPIPELRGITYDMFSIAGKNLDTATTSWRRLSDEPRKRADARSAWGGQLPPVKVNEAQQVASWENEGGRSALHTEPLRILIVDDDIGSSSSLELMLRASGHAETRVAYSGHAALAIAAAFQPSVVLLELGLLDMSVYDVARILRERAQSHDLRLIALTSRREHAGRELARVAGFESHLLKPVAAIDLAALIADARKSR